MITSPGLEALFENASIGIVVINAGGEIVLANKWALHQFGYTAAEMVGLPAEQLLPQRFKANRKRFFRQLKTRHMGSEGDLYALTKDGREFPVEVSLTHYKSANEAFVAAYITDISVRKAAEQELKNLNAGLEQKVQHRTLSLLQTVKKLSEQIKHVKVKDQELQKANAFLSSMWNNAGAIIIVTDTSGTIELFNPAAEKYLGYTSAEVVGKQTPLLFHDSTEVQLYAAQFSEELGTVIEPGFETFVAKARRNLPNQYEWTYITKSGKRLPVDVAITALRNEQKEITGFLGIAFDMTSQKQAEIELRGALQKQREVNELKSRFVSIASHEFRTPLSTIVSSAYLISQYKKSEDQEKRKSHIDRIIASTEMLTDILDDFLSVGKIEEGKIQVRPREFDIAEHITAIITDLQGITKKGQTLHYQHKGDVLALTDPAILKHIVFNLLSNAIKFSPEEAVITVATENYNGKLLLSVKDQGIGIPDNEQAHLFDLFFRASNANHIQGTGLGLHIMKRYTELLDGNIHFKSRLGKGTEFQVAIHQKMKYEKDLAY